MWLLSIVEHILFAIVVAVFLRILVERGRCELARVIVVSLQELPGVKGLIGKIIAGEASKFVKKNALSEEEKQAGARKQRAVIPKKGNYCELLM